MFVPDATISPLFRSMESSIPIVIIASVKAEPEHIPMANSILVQQNEEMCPLFSGLWLLMEQVRIFSSMLIRISVRTSFQKSFLQCGKASFHPEEKSGLRLQSKI